MPTDPLHERLQALPQPPLPPQLWPRLARRRQRQLAIRRSGMALALGLLVVGPLVLPWRGQDAPVIAHAPATVASSDVAAVAPAAMSAIDHALQNAYARGASDEEVAPLWEVRRRLAGDARPLPPTDPS